ncbi:MAG: hypothetical protein A3D87_07605 [Omnitrophica WOR_2 bacterium RIFCSPHIGHO2_02_FULL_50_17]|nr:MAG: hypothetical protein A3D87_07605 [Omnitrophica WOR_2 bacterium RIFCSPHIGHO2_02_FULL_50_17]
MQHYRLVLIIGALEILIGSVTVLFNLTTLALSLNAKSPNVLAFVLVSGIMSILIGFGILNLKKPAYQLLLYFSSVILLSKFLIFMEIVHLNGALETTIPGPLKNISSIAYHSLVIFYLKKSGVKQIFHT